MKNLKTMLTLVLLASVPLIPQAFAGDYAIVVNSGNAASADLSEIKNLYLKKKTSWSSGTAATPLGRSNGSPEQEAFLSTVLGMSQAELDSYWASEKSKTGATGPREVGSSNILLRQIGRKEGAFGIVPSSETSGLPDGVKVLTNF